METYQLEVRRKYKASAEKLFEAWTNPEMLKQWFCPESMTVPVAEVDLEVGGKHKVVMRSKEGNEYTAVGEYLEIEKPKKLAMTWQWQDDQFKDENSVLTVEFEEMGEETEVTLTHSKLKSEKSKESHTQGWTSAMEHLNKFLG